MRRLFLCIAVFSIALASVASERQLKVTVSNPGNADKADAPVVIALTDGDVCSALVEINGIEVPCQLDDLNDDGVFDELCFLVDISKKSALEAVVTLSSEGEPRQYTPRVYGSFSLRDRSAKNPKHLPVKSLTVPASSNSYQYVFPHGPLMESELIGYRVYCDHRQSVDLYGHRNKQLELSETAFYPSAEQKEKGYGDDVLYTGSTYGCGTLHGWNGENAVMFENVRTRTYNVLAAGPLRTIIETVNKGWRATPQAKPVDVTTHYILYAGHRDVEMSVTFSRPVGDLQLSTGVTDIIGSEKLTDGKGLLGCWGTALAGNNPQVYENHTVGLAVCVPEANFKGESYFSDLPKEKAGTMGDNGKLILPNQAYVAVVGTETASLRYWFTATCDLETFGFADAKAWMKYLKAWKKDLQTPLTVEVK